MTDAGRFLVILACSALTAIVLFGGGCAPTSAYVAARQIETTASTFVDTAADTWHAYSHARLENIKDGCADLACFKTVAAQWESGTVVPADKAIATARDAVKTFDGVLNATDAVKQSDFSAAIQQLLSALESASSVLDGFGVKVTVPQLKAVK